MIIPIKPWLELVEESASPFSGGKRSPGLQSGLVLSADPAADEFRLGGSGYRNLYEGNPMSDRKEFYHEPIMGEKILEILEPLEGKQVFDGTLGGGGHSQMCLENGAHVIGCDQDAAAIEHASKHLAHFEDRFLPVRGNFAEMDQLLSDVGVDQVDAILLDLGVSSRQLDDGSRGFSFREDAPLDMRMDDRSELTAAVIVNHWEEAELVRIFREFGEERRSRRAAAEILRARAGAPIETTFQLAKIVEKAVPRVSGKHPATRVFQAIRIAVNRELDVLEEVLEKTVPVLAPGGVLAVLTFHSLEDRIVKHFMRRRSAPELDRPEWPEPRPNPDFAFTLPFRKAAIADAEEAERNPRSRSAKLRAAIRN
ncbi:16S rRNA (cytosine(1402)-N(4))-methyltransferase RsmH [Verrucomicrobiales bacterium]|nr:16S rRNA (cytosine(1402)-N(4))-methyltransferase RsmH [Verrucomicrobiales bacterium]MDA9924132.1 16S rRNA (cytosine(1402)-N(4))-methyltransferase RsmH [Verrucomicrobiales bacterium]MDB3941017.1 16S rRNA (cytosine(1402)-N(4))-methyltransferase RsmH [Verrucomicrobiales bacterium]